MTDTDSTSSGDRPLSELLSEHLRTCSDCQPVIESKTRPYGFGMVSRLCFKYQDIIATWSDKEGEINNIVAHDEFGNQASANTHERYPDSWR